MHGVSTESLNRLKNRKTATAHANQQTSRTEWMFRATKQRKRSQAHQLFLSLCQSGPIRVALEHSVEIGGVCEDVQTCRIQKRRRCWFSLFRWIFMGFSELLNGVGGEVAAWCASLRRRRVGAVKPLGCFGAFPSFDFVTGVIWRFWHWHLHSGRHSFCKFSSCHRDNFGPITIDKRVTRIIPDRTATVKVEEIPSSNWTWQ